MARVRGSWDGGAGNSVISEDDNTSPRPFHPDSTQTASELTKNKLETPYPASGLLCLPL